MLDTYLLIIELVGTIAFASSGAMVGVKKQMDLLGVCVLGMTTAVGGGMIRDLILGVTPPIMFQTPVYALVAISFSILVPTKQYRSSYLPNTPIKSRFGIIASG